MKRSVLVLLTVFVSFFACIAAASPKQDVPDNGRLIPMLVSVNVKGEATDVTPAYKLRPTLAQTLRDTVRKMITKPAMKDGKPVASELVLTLALVPVAQDAGKYNIQYVATKPLPPGTWHWVTESNNQLALANQSTQMVMPLGEKMAKLREIYDQRGFHWDPTN